MQLSTPKMYICLFLCSLSIFLYEILIVRIFSVLFVYNILFIMISLAILGLGLGGIFYQWYRSRVGSGDILPLEVLILFPLSVDLSLMLTTKLFYLFNMVICTLITLLPFFFGGIILAAIYHWRAEASSKLYFIDLVGGASGCLLSLLIVQRVGVINAVLVAGLLASLPPLLLSTNFAQKRKNAVLPFILSGLILLYSISINPFAIGPEELAHAGTPLGTIMNYPRVKAVWFRNTWDIYSRCDLVKTNKDDLQRSIYINGGTEAVMIRHQDDLSALELFKYNLTFIPYLFNRNDEVLILGSGGGRDVRLALLAGAERVTAVEINQGVINMVMEEKEYHGDIYGQEKVNLVVEDGRTFIMQDEGSYDRIVLSLAYSYAFSDLNSIAQLENYLYTKEAFKEYFEHLNDEGTITIFVDYPELVEKFILTALDYFGEQGIAPTQAMNHITALATNYWSGYAYALIIKKTRFRPETAAAIKSRTEGIDIRALHLPYHPGDNDFYRMAAGELTPQEYLANSSHQLAPSTDNNPFFLEVAMNYRHKLIFLIIAMGIMLLLVIIAYLGVVIKRLERNPADSQINKGYIKYFVPYFIIIGICFMLVEISLTKRFSFYLGYPQLNLAVILFSLLVGCGLGAIFSARFKHQLARRLSLISIILCLLLIGVQLSLTPFIAHTVGFSLPVRSVLLAFYLLPVSFCLGMPFPLGLRLLKLRLGGDISWFWGINGICSVIGSVLSVVLAMAWGFNLVFYSAALAYLGIGVIGHRLASTGYEGE